MVDPFEAPALQVRSTLPSPETDAPVVDDMTGAAGVPAGRAETIAASPLPADVVARTRKYVVAPAVNPVDEYEVTPAPTVVRFVQVTPSSELSTVYPERVDPPVEAGADQARLTLVEEETVAVKFNGAVAVPTGETADEAVT